MKLYHTQHNRLMKPLDDDIPMAPGAMTAPEQTESSPDAVDFEVPDIPEDLMAAVPEGPETMKRGVYHFRLNNYEKKIKAENGQPNFNLEWVCQEEPYTGRRAWDPGVPGVLKQDVLDAMDAGSPCNEEARKLLKDRLWKQKAIMKAAGYRGTNFEEFLKTSPELKISGDVVPKMKDSGRVDKGKKVYIPDGTKTQWKIKEYLPLSS